MRVLVLAGDAWHPAEIVQRGLGALDHAGFDFEHVEEGGRWSPAMMDEFPLVVVAKANHLGATDQRPWLTADSQAAFRQYVQRGGGLFVVHAGACYKDLPDMRGITGGAFLQHPDQCAVTVEPKAGHALAEGVESFTAQDEHYIMALDDAGADVFLRSRSGHGVQPAGWTRTEGGGRVCVLTPGHNAEVWLQSSFQKLLENALGWLAAVHNPKVSQ